MSGKDTEALKDLITWHVLVSVDFLEDGYHFSRILFLSVKLESQKVDTQLILIPLRDVVASFLY